jgi:hypothetical protein
LCGQLIYTWSLDQFLAVATDVPIAQVIGQNENDIGFLFAKGVEGNQLPQCEQEKHSDQTFPEAEIHFLDGVHH